MTTEQITAYLDSVYEAVNKSKFGPIEGKSDDRKKLFMNPGLDIARIVIMGMAPKGFSVHEPKQEWQG